MKPGALAAALTALLGSALLLNPLREIALDDDWVFYLGVRRLLEDGVWEIPANATPSLAAHTLWGWLFSSGFGLSHGVLRVSTLVLAAVALAALSSLSGEGKSRRPAPLGPSFLLLANPIFFLLSFTFMTDVPFLAWSLLALALYRKGLNPSRDGFLLLGALAAGAAVWTRQIGIFSALAAAWCVRSGGRLSPRRAALILGIPGVCLGLACASRWSAWAATAFLQEALWTQWSRPAWLLAELYYRWSSALLYLALFTLPLALLQVRGLGVSIPRPVTAVTGLGVFLPALLRRPSFPFFTGIIHDRGLGTLTLSEAPMKAAGPLGTPVWGALLTAAAFISIFLWLGRLRELGAAFKRAEVRLLAFAALPQFALLSLGPRLYDRYLLPLIPFALLWASRAAPENSPAPAGRGTGWGPALALLFFSWSVLGTWDYLNWNSAKWEAGRRAPEFGIPRNELKNGWDWEGLFRSAPEGREELFSGKVSFSPFGAEGGAVLLAVPYWTPLSLSPGNVYLVR